MHHQPKPKYFQNYFALNLIQVHPEKVPQKTPSM